MCRRAAQYGGFKIAWHDPFCKLRVIASDTLEGRLLVGAGISLCASAHGGATQMLLMPFYFHPQVMQVVKEQVMRALTTKPSSLDQFKNKLQNLSYAEILKIRQSERMNQEDFQSRPIL